MNRSKLVQIELILKLMLFVGFIMNLTKTYVFFFSLVLHEIIKLSSFVYSYARYVVYTHAKHVVLAYAKHVVLAYAIFGLKIL